MFRQIYPSTTILLEGHIISNYENHINIPLDVTIESLWVCVVCPWVQRDNRGMYSIGYDMTWYRLNLQLYWDSSAGGAGHVKARCIHIYIYIFHKGCSTVNSFILEEHLHNLVWERDKCTGNMNFVAHKHCVCSLYMDPDSDADPAFRRWGEEQTSIIFTKMSPRAIRDVAFCQQAEHNPFMGGFC